ncbi:MAG: haloacid dehalogenase-like hydrolase [Elusimicrobiota bacterium]
MSGEEGRSVPLCVDLDGTLIRTDLLAESVLSLLRKDPLAAFRLPFWLLRGKAHLKRRIAERVDLSAAALPYDSEFLDFLKEERAAGRPLVLVTASDRKYAQAVAEHLGIFSDVIASDGATNLLGETKLEVLHEKFADGFDYAGDSFRDLPVWRGARRAILVRAGEAVVRTATAHGNVWKVFEKRGGRLSELLRALRRA